MRLKISVPYQTMQAKVSRLRKLQQASDILRRTSRFVVLSRRLQTQMTDMETSLNQQLAETSDREDGKERVIAKAALSDTVSEG